MFYNKRCSKKFRKSHRKIPVPESLFIKKETQHSCFPVNFAKFLRTPFLQNTSGRLLLRSSIENKGQVFRWLLSVNRFFPLWRRACIALCKISRFNVVFPCFKTFFIVLLLFPFVHKTKLMLLKKNS